MLLTDSNEIPVGDWLYESKYDGYRCILSWDKDIHYPVLKSRNDNILNEKFPEIIKYCESIYDKIAPHLPLILDGEVVYLKNDFQSEFSIVQKRGRMNNPQTINSNADTFPCHYIAFDILQYKGKPKLNSQLTTRKQMLTKFFDSINHPTTVSYIDERRLQAIDAVEDSDLIWERVKTHNGEGVIAKKKTSKWVEGTRSTSWLKIKNWKYVDVILTKFDKSNGFFAGAIYKEDNLLEIVSFKHGLKEEENKTLTTFFKTYGTSLGNEVSEIPPSICVSIACIDFDGSKLREPRFHSFQHTINPDECSWNNMQRQLNPIPENVVVTHPDKPVFPVNAIIKDDYLLYLQKVAPFMMPFLKDRLLTVIRYPHGLPGESFYQKNYLENIPDYVTTHIAEETNCVICNNIETLLWLGNQLAIEFHIPFQTIHTDKPTEIVFDLDPPSVEEFHLAVNAALKLKAILDHFSLQSFIKISGGKGMQVYIPLPFNTFTYKETGIFTEFVCKFLEQQYPKWFTVERLKKNRENRLYLDYVQHREGKTIVAPYSTRGNANGLVAAPLYWDEVNEHLKPKKFTTIHVMERIRILGNPFREFKEAGENQPFKTALDQMNGLG